MAQEVPEGKQTQQQTQMIKKGIAKSGRQEGDESPIVLCERARSVIVNGKKLSVFNMKHPKNK